MELTLLDVFAFVAFLVVVIAVSLYVSRKEGSGEDYFLAGRNLTWWLIGVSLVASNISTEHFVGMAGSAFGSFGLAVASYEWIAAISMVIVAWWLLPMFLRAGIYTMPQFLEYRYNEATRTTMSIYLMVLTVIAVLVTVLYSGSRGLDGVFDFSGMLEEAYGMDPQAAEFWAMWGGAWVIGIVAAAYTIYGGLKAVVWSDLIQGCALLGGGAIVLYYGLKLVGGGTLDDGGGVTGGSVLTGWQNFQETNADKLHMIKPADDPELPWTAMLLAIWIPNLFYWGMNQFITQRTLGARSLAEGQKGLFLACGIKIIMPFLIVVPGIIAFQSFGDQILSSAGGDQAKAGELAYPYLITNIMPPALRGIMLAALAGAVMSTFNSGINSASTLFTVDIYEKFIHPDADAKEQVRVGRIATGVIALTACLMAPLPGMFQGVFNYIQEIWGFISPAIVSAFFFGMLLKRAPAVSGLAALLIGPIIYGAFRVPGWIMNGVGFTQNAEGVVTHDGAAVTGLLASFYRFTQIAYLHHMAVALILIFLMMLTLSFVRPRTDQRILPDAKVDITPHPLRYVYGGVIIVIILALYIYFR